MSDPSDQMSPLVGDVGAVPDGMLRDALVVVDADETILPVNVAVPGPSIANFDVIDPALFV